MFVDGSNRHTSRPWEGSSMPLLVRFKGNLGRFSRHRGGILD